MSHDTEALDMTTAAEYMEGVLKKEGDGELYKAAAHARATVAIMREIMSTSSFKCNGCTSNVVALEEWAGKLERLIAERPDLLGHKHD